MSTGSWEMCEEMIGEIKRLVKPGSTILELGSGESTGILFSAGFRMISVEQNYQYLSKHPSHYIHAPLVNDWYDPDPIREGLGGFTYQAIIIDGPASADRRNMLDHLHLFDMDVTIFVDDIDRPKDAELFEKLTKGRRYDQYAKYGVIHAV